MQQNSSNHQAPLNILIMAAGLGTRMRSDLAKVLHCLDGRPLVNHVCQTAAALSPGTICVVVGHQREDVEKAVLAEAGETNFEFAWQKEQLGTGDAVNAAREIFAGRDGKLVVLSGDVPMIEADTLRQLIEAGADAACSILTVKLNDPTGYGRVLRGADGGFDRIVEQKDATDEEKLVNEINSGIYCFDTRKLFAALTRVGKSNAQGEYYLTDVPAILKTDGERVEIFLHGHAQEIEGINDRKQLSDMERTLRWRNNAALMRDAGVTMIDPQHTYVSGLAAVGKDTVIHPNVSIEGRSEIGAGCTIRSGTRITNSLIGSGVEILDNCVITDSEVGDGCTVGPMAHLRGHAVMQQGAKVGNFVELKKTRLGRKSKANHLTYLGDAEIGEATNIGAGTITCNYDGKNKHQTRIGNNVKIGSDTMLVAPIEVGDGAVTGAGSVVTKDVEPGKLVVGSPARAIKDVADAAEGSGQKQ